MQVPDNFIVYDDEINSSLWRLILEENCNVNEFIENDYKNWVSNMVDGG